MTSLQVLDIHHSVVVYEDRQCERRRAGGTDTMCTFLPAHLAGCQPIGLPRAEPELPIGIVPIRDRCARTSSGFAAANWQPRSKEPVPRLSTRMRSLRRGETVMDARDIYGRSASLRLGLRTARALTGYSEFVLNDAVARFALPSHRGVVVPNRVQIDDAVEPEPVELPFDRFVLAMGRVVEKKGFDLLIDAFSQIADRHPAVGLVIGGDGAARKVLHEKVRSSGLEGRVVLPGRFSRGNVRWATSRASAFVLPSRVEPFGIVVLEAMVAGLPVIVSGHGGAVEIVRDGVDGLVVDPVDRQALGAAIDRLLSNGAERERLIGAGRERVRSFEWPVITREYLGLYDQVRDTRAARGGNRARVV